YIALDETDYFAGESLNVKVLTKTGSAQLALGSATVHAIEMVGLANRPYPPGNFKIKGEYFPDSIYGVCEITWVGRNRLQQTGGIAIGFTDSHINPEENTSYIIRVKNPNSGALVFESEEILEHSFLLDTELIPLTIAKIEIYSKRGGYESLYAQSCVSNIIKAGISFKFEDVEYIPPVGSEVDFTFE
ncbi:MAG: hypothetical protein L0G96_24460, partial [Acinetobacter sp.]|nr:hypothetical protein [Acinetobacter sp.]